MHGVYQCNLQHVPVNPRKPVVFRLDFVIGGRELPDLGRVRTFTRKKSNSE